MPEAICDTSPLQYLHQIKLLELLPALYGNVMVPPAVVQELAIGQQLGIVLPDLGQFRWITIINPTSIIDFGPEHELGDGERGVICLGMDFSQRTLILDDLEARV